MRKKALLVTMIILFILALAATIDLAVSLATELVSAVSQVTEQALILIAKGKMGYVPGLAAYAPA